MFAVFVLAGGVLTLRACGTWPVLGFVRNYCPAPPDGAFAKEVATGESLRRQVHAAEMALASAPPCAPARAPAAQPPAAPAIGPAPSPPPLSPAERAESEAIDALVRKGDGTKGRLQFTLAWNTLDDLDLIVFCPGGRISSFRGESGPGICAEGVKDLDANGQLTKNVSTTPVENVVWPNEYPPGSYKVAVIKYCSSSAGNGDVPFTLRLKRGDDVQLCRGTIGSANEDDGSCGGVRRAYLARTITWRSGSSFPECQFSDETVTP